MELRQLRYLISLANEGSFTRAAEASSVAQPALSRQIQKLEREMGLPLVDRTTRRVALTAAGREVVSTGQRILNELNLLDQSLNQTKTLLKGTVTIGVTQTPGPVNVPKLLAAFSRAHPGVELVVREGLSVDLAAQLREDRLELALVSSIGVSERDQLELQPCRQERMAVLLPAGHRLASLAEIRIIDLRHERFVSFPPQATIREAVESAALQAGFRPRVSLETNDIGRMVELVAEGLGVAILPASDARRNPLGTVAVALTDPPLRHEMLVARRAGRHLGPAAEAMRKAILSVRAAKI